MGKVSEYISSLEGKENIDPLVIASTLLELHNEEISTADSKIASLETTIAENQKIISERDIALRDQKAKNWDLVNRVPAENSGSQEDPNKPDVRDATFDDFFQKEE